MNTNNHQGGFTIIELLLFIAVSMVMLAIGFTSIAGRTQDVQFTDSIRTIESQLRRNLSNVGFGLNLRGDLDCVVVGGVLDFPAGDSSPQYPTPGTNLDCVANGVLLSFDSGDSFTVEAVAAWDDPEDGASSLEDLNNKLASNLVRPIPNTAQNITYNWQTRFIGAVIENGPVAQAPQVDFLRARALESSAEYIFARTNSADNFAGNVVTSDQEFVLCFEGSNGRRASVTVGSAARFEANFDDARCDSL